MKPTAPPLSRTDAAPESSLQSAVARACETRATDERITIPAPPTPETLQAATPCPPARALEESGLDTIPAPPPSSIRKREGDVDAVPSTIPGAPRLPKFHSM